jgi:hypothetical protein
LRRTVICYADATMRRWLVPLGLGLALGVGGCRDDHVGSTGQDDASGTDGNESGTGNDDADPTGDPGPGPDSPCENNADCEDDNPCTNTMCGPEGTCVFTPITSLECRPQIDVDYPPRAATLQGNSAGVTVTGTVHSPSGDIVSFTINGTEVELGSGGSFSHQITATQGGNTLVLETMDELDQPRRRVQSFLWSPEYAKPEPPMSGLSANGLGIYLSQDVIDDNDRSAPIDDLGTILDLALDSFDIAALFNPNTVVASTAGYDVYLTDLTVGGTEVTLTSIDGGLHVDASLTDILGDLYFDCTTFTCELAGGSGTGGLSIDVVTLSGDLRLDVADDHTIDIDLVNVQTIIDPNDVNVWADNWWTDVVIAVVEFFVLDSLVGDIADQLNSEVQNTLGPLLEDGLDQFNLNTSLDLPNLADPEMPIVVDLVTDFGVTDFHDGNTPPNPSPPRGGLIVLRGGGFVDDDVAPYDNLGIPLREGCGEGDDGMPMPRESLMEIGLHDDLLNQLLYGAWRGGLLEFPLPEDLLGSGGDDALYTDLDVFISGMLAPTASDCGSGELLAHIGDMRIDASLTLLDQPITFVAYSTLVVRVEVSDLDGSLGITLTGVEDVQTELTVGEDDAIDVEPTLISVLETQLTDGLLGALGGGALGAIELPQMDLSDTLGLPPGTALIAIQVESVGRAPGTTVISGHL